LSLNEDLQIVGPTIIQGQETLNDKIKAAFSKNDSPPSRKELLEKQAEYSLNLKNAMQSRGLPKEPDNGYLLHTFNPMESIQPQTA
jgi:hypothetical protein